MDYTDLYNFSTNSGVIVPSAGEAIDGIRERYREIFGSDVDLSPETIVGRLVEKDVVFLRSVLGVTAQCANQFNIWTATGTFLDSLAQLFNLKRMGGTKTIVQVELKFSNANVLVQAGVKMMDDDGNMFTLQGDVKSTRGPDADGYFYGSGVAMADDYGPIAGEEGSINKVQTSVLGWVGVTNMRADQVGSLVETDAAFRKRIMSSRTIGIGFKASLISKLSRLDGVYSVNILDNNDLYPKMESGVAIPGHTIFVCVHSTGAPELEGVIAEIMSEHIPIGTSLKHDEIQGTELVAKSIIGTWGSSEVKKIYFYSPQIVNVSVKIVVDPRLYPGLDCREDVKNAVYSYIASLGVDEDVHSSMIASAVMSSVSMLSVSSVTISPTDPTDLRRDLTSFVIYGFQKAACSLIDIDVKYISETIS